MVIELRVSTSPPPISLGIIIFPLQRQLPTELPKALASAGSGRGILPCAPALESPCCFMPGSVVAVFWSGGFIVVLPGFEVWSCCAWAASATAQSANNSVLIASLLLCWFARAPYRGACAEGTCPIIVSDLQARSCFAVHAPTGSTRRGNEKR